MHSLSRGIRALLIPPLLRFSSSFLPSFSGLSFLYLASCTHFDSYFFLAFQLFRRDQVACIRYLFFPPSIYFFSLSLCPSLSFYFCREIGDCTNRNSQNNPMTVGSDICATLSLQMVVRGGWGSCVDDESVRQRIWVTANKCCQRFLQSNS